MIEAKVICDSINEFNDRITTLEVVMPRIVLAEFNTHRMFTRNSASSRAIPFNKMVDAINDNPFIPLGFQKEHKGMQGTEYYTRPEHINIARGQWLNAKKKAIIQASELNEGIYKTVDMNYPTQKVQEGVTKQICNRLLEPFMYHKVLVTATEWKNFMKLRAPKYVDSKGEVFNSRIQATIYGNFNELPPHIEDDLGWAMLSASSAEIHIQKTAECIYQARIESKPSFVDAGYYHLPYASNIDLIEFAKFLSNNGLLNVDYSEKECVLSLKGSSLYQHFLLPNLIKISVARAARVSYTTVGEEKKVDFLKDFNLHDRLAEAGHWSPFEHIAKSMSDKEYKDNTKREVVNGEHIMTYGISGNFVGFLQYRKTFKNEAY